MLDGKKNAPRSREKFLQDENLRGQLAFAPALPVSLALDCGNHISETASCGFVPNRKTS